MPIAITWSPTSTVEELPSVSGLSQSSGPATGGNTILVLGSGFTAATAVTFGSTAAASFTVVSDNAILVNAPAQAAGTVDVTVTTPAGTSATSSSDKFTGLPQPLRALPGFQANRGFMEQMMGVKERLPDELVSGMTASTWGERLKDRFRLMGSMFALVRQHFGIGKQIRAFYVRLHDALGKGRPDL